MITEDYVSNETAKLLKEKGFEGYSIITIYDEDAANAYVKELQEKHLPYSSDDPKLKEFFYTKPTLQMAMKWLREVHHVACFICPSIEQGFHTNKWNSYIDKLSDNFPKDPLWFVETSDSYEQACEAAIKYCLKHLIK